MMNKATCLEILDVCITRRTCKLNCMNCEFNGDKCVTAHKHAIRCIKELSLIKEREKENEKNRQNPN